MTDTAKLKLRVKGKTYESYEAYLEHYTRAARRLGRLQALAREKKP